MTDLLGAPSGSYRVNRGGSWWNDSIYCRSAIRDMLKPDIGWLLLGFRLALVSSR